MPGFNGTGPKGRGQGPDRGRGPSCAGGRRGSGCRRGGPGGRGLGFRGAGIAVSAEGADYGSRQDETGPQHDEKAYLEGELETIQKRLAELGRQS